MNRLAVAAALLIAWTLACPSHAAAQAPADAPPAAGEGQAFVEALADADAEQAKAIVAEVQARVNQQARFLGPKLIDALMKAKQYEALDRLTMQCLTTRAVDAEAVAMLAQARVRVLHALNRPDDALAAAKSFYNVAPLRMTRQTVEAVALRLQQARGPDGPAQAKAFREQQRVAANDAKSNDTAAADATAAAPPATGPSATVLASIKVDAASYLNAARQRGEPTPALKAIARGNLLLLADRPKDARAAFEAAQSAAQGREQTLARDGIARSIHAATGSVAQANAYLATPAAPATGRSQFPTTRP